MPCLDCYFPILSGVAFSVDRQTGGDRRYPDDPYLYPTEQGKRSLLIPVFKYFTYTNISGDSTESFNCYLCQL
jgi:hypothetical protein